MWTVAFWIGAGFVAAWLLSVGAVGGLMVAALLRDRRWRRAARAGGKTAAMPTHDDPARAG